MKTEWEQFSFCSTSLVIDPLKLTIGAILNAINLSMHLEKPTSDGAILNAIDLNINHETPSGLLAFDTSWQTISAAISSGEQK